MSFDAAVVTAVYDSYDTLKPALPQPGVRVDWVCVTDNPHLEVEGWRTVVRPCPGLHPNRSAKVPKMFPERFTPAPVSVWVDASFRVTSGTFVADVLPYAEPIAQFVHPWRNCLYDEADASSPIPKYTGEPILEQAKEYREEGHPEHWGLWATGVIVRRHMAETAQFGQSWLSEIDRWSFQDQVSEPFALRNCGLRPVSLPGTHFANPWLAYEGSGRH